MKNDIRWIQRLEHFEQTFTLLKEAVQKGDLNELEKSGLANRFELAFELAWKTMKDYLEYEGFTVASPRETIRQAYEAGYIRDGQIFMDLLEVRNRLTHDYDGHYFSESETIIRNDATSIFQDLLSFFHSKLGLLSDSQSGI